VYPSPKPDEEREKEARRRQAAKLARLDHQEARAIPRDLSRRGSHKRPDPPGVGARRAETCHNALVGRYVMAD